MRAIIPSKGKDMKLEFYINPETGDRHIHDHNVFEKEIKEAFNNFHLWEQRKDGSFIMYSKLQNGRYLKIIYRKLNKSLYFIITAFDLKEQFLIDLLDKEVNE